MEPFTHRLYVKLDTHAGVEKMQEYRVRWITTGLAGGYAP